MCGVEVISLKSMSCRWLQTPNHHIWQKYTYTLCPTGARSESHCDNAQSVNGQTEIDNGSARMMECPVCAELAAADEECTEKKRLADEEYNRAYAAAFRQEVHIYPLDSPPGSSRSRGDRDRRRHDSESQHGNGNGGRGKRRDRDRYTNHEEKSKKYYDNTRGPVS